MVTINGLDNEHLQWGVGNRLMVQKSDTFSDFKCADRFTPTLVTHIWLVVSVPVLSEQMTEVQPRVSTEGRLLTMAFFLAIRRVPRARQVVMTAGRPER